MILELSIALAVVAVAVAVTILAALAPKPPAGRPLPPIPHRWTDQELVNRVRRGGRR